MYLLSLPLLEKIKSPLYTFLYYYAISPAVTSTVHTSSFFSLKKKVCKNKKNVGELF